jgi:hypothetical protein
MADKGIARIVPAAPIGVDTTGFVPVMPGEGGGGGTPVPTVGVIFPSGNA